VASSPETDHGAAPASSEAAALPALVDRTEVLRKQALRHQANDLGVEALDAPIMKKMASLFLDDTRKALAVIAEAAEVDDWSQVADEAHQIKGAAPHVGAEALAEVGKALERAVRERRIEQARRAVDLLPDLVAETEVALREALGPLSEQ